MSGVIDAVGQFSHERRDREDVVLAAVLNLTKAVEGLTTASVRQAQLLEVLLEAMPAATEARILGILERTIRRRRKTRRLGRLVEAA